jgi:hypothetical protein
MEILEISTDNAKSLQAKSKKKSKKNSQSPPSNASPPRQPTKKRAGTKQKKKEKHLAVSPSQETLETLVQSNVSSKKAKEQLLRDKTYRDLQATRKSINYSQRLRKLSPAGS